MLRTPRFSVTSLAFLSLAACGDARPGTGSGGSPSPDGAASSTPGACTPGESGCPRPVSSAHAGAGACEAPSRTCGRVCAPCPSGDEVVATECAGNRCVAARCGHDFEPCGRGCCPKVTFAAGTQGSAGRCLSLMIDSADGVHIGYGGFVPLDHLYYRGPSGPVEVVASPRPSQYGSLSMTSTATLDASGKPVFAYHYDSLDIPETYFARKNGGWTATQKLLGAAARTTMASGGGVVGYAVSSDGSFSAYRESSPSLWLSCGGYADNYRDDAFRIDESGSPHLVCHPAAGSKRDLVYATVGPVGKSTETIDDAGSTGTGSTHRSQLALDGTGAPHVVYQDLVARELRYARRAPQGWLKTVIAPFDSTILVGAGIQSEQAIVVDKNGDAHVFFAQTYGGPMLHARQTPQGFVVSPVQAAPSVSYEIEAELDSKGRIHVLYQVMPSDGIAELVSTAP